MLFASALSKQKQPFDYTTKYISPSPKKTNKKQLKLMYSCKRIPFYSGDNAITTIWGWIHCLGKKQVNEEEAFVVSAHVSHISETPDKPSKHLNILLFLELIIDAGLEMQTRTHTYLKKSCNKPVLAIITPV